MFTLSNLTNIMSSPAKKTVELFYDVVSPYTWIAFEVLCRYRTEWQMDLKLKPFFLGGVMKASDNTPPGFVPAKMRYMMQDLDRLATHYKMPYKFAEDAPTVMFVKGTLGTQRFITAVDMTNPEKTEELSRQLALSFWSKGEDISEVDTIVKAAKKAGMNEAVIQDAVSRMKTDEVKNRLKNFTEEALKHGAFGSPTIIAHVGDKAHMIFGSDRFHILADILGEKYIGPLNEKSQL